MLGLEGVGVKCDVVASDRHILIDLVRLPGGPGLNLPCSAGGLRFDPWLGTKSHMPQLRPKATK